MLQCIVYTSEVSVSLHLMQCVCVCVWGGGGGGGGQEEARNAIIVSRTEEQVLSQTVALITLHHIPHNCR